MSRFLGSAERRVACCLQLGDAKENRLETDGFGCKVCSEHLTGVWSAARQHPGAKPDEKLGKVMLLLGGLEQGKDAKNGLAAALAASEGRSDSVSLLERGGSTFSVESGDGAPERRCSFQVRGMAKGREGRALLVSLYAMPACRSPASAHKQRNNGAAF